MTYIFISKFLKSGFIKSVGLINTTVALFLFDFNNLFLKKESDVLIAGILGVSFTLFVLEMSLTLYARKNYFCSFFMILDVLGTLSLIPDLLELQGNLESSDQTDLEVARAGRAGRLARTAQTFRFTRFARLFRVIRLVRVARVFRLVQTHQNKDMEEEIITTSTPSKLGIILGDTVYLSNQNHFQNIDTYLNILNS